MKTKVTDRRFPGSATKDMAPAVLPTISNLYDMYFNAEDSNSCGLEIVEVDIGNGTPSNDGIDINAPTTTDSELQSHPENNVQKQRKRKGKPTTELQSKRVKHQLPVLYVGEQPPVYVDEHSTPYWEVERVIGKRMVDNEPEYLVKWKGCPVNKNTWEPMRSFHPLTMDCVWDYEYYLERIKEDEESEQNTQNDTLLENSAPISPPQPTSNV